MPNNSLRNPSDFFEKLFGDFDFGPLSGSDFWADVFVSARVFFIVLDIILLIAFIWVFIQALKFRPKLEPYKVRQKKTLTLRDTVFKDRWDFIMKKVSGAGSVDALKLAIIEADKLADDALKKLGLRGEHMADRLEHLSSEQIRTLDRLWRAHRLRNDLVHTPDFNLTPEAAGRILEDYRAFLKEIGVLIE